MKLILTLTGVCLSLIALGQSPPKTLHIQISYQKAGHYLERAVETIEAVNTVGAGTTVEYKAGQSVALLPGFEAKAGSIFTAEVKSVNSTSELTLQLKAFPNPFEQSTTIDYYLPADGKVNLWITDSQGKVVNQLVKDESQSAGKHQIEWRPEAINAGIYIPIVEANQQKAIGRLVKK